MIPLQNWFHATHMIQLLCDPCKHVASLVINTGKGCLSSRYELFSFSHDSFNNRGERLQAKYTRQIYLDDDLSIENTETY